MAPWGGRNVRTKQERGVLGSPLFRSTFRLCALELIAPRDVGISPAAASSYMIKGMLMGTDATEIARHVRVSLDCANGSSLAKVGSIPPSHSGANAHAVGEKIPDVPFT